MAMANAHSRTVTVAIDLRISQTTFYLADIVFRLCSASRECPRRYDRNPVWQDISKSCARAYTVGGVAKNVFENVSGVVIIVRTVGSSDRSKAVTLRGGGAACWRDRLLAKP